MHIAIVAGEQSGDVLAAPLMVALRAIYPDVVFSGVGGPLMQQVGLDAIGDFATLSVMGLWEVLPKLPSIFALKKQLLRYWSAHPPDVFIGVDAPDFNLRLARVLHGRGIKTVHYVSPSLWAWKERRIEQIKPNIDLMLCLFPFECAVYQRHGVRVCCVGHPARDRICRVDQGDAERQLGLGRALRLGIFPGSRQGEVERLLPIYLATYRQLTTVLPQLQAVVSCANARLLPLIQRLCADVDVVISQQSPELLMSAADVLLLTSGTVTLEAALLARPMVVGYRVHPITAYIAKRLLHIRRFSLPNLLLQDDVVPEFIQQDCRADHLSASILSLLTNQAVYRQQQQHLQRITELLPLGVSQRAAGAIANVIA